MNDRQLDKKVHQDAVRVRKDLNDLIEHSTARFNRYVDRVGKNSGSVKEDFTERMEEGIAQLSQGFEKLTSGAAETVSGAASSMKTVGQGLRQYGATAQKMATKVTRRRETFGKRAASYTLVGVTLALAIGFLLGSYLKPTRPPMN